MKKKINKYDLLLILVIIIINIALLFYVSKNIVNTQGNEAYVYSDNKLVGQYILKDGYKNEFTIKLNEGFNTVHIENNEVWISDSSCPDKLCQHQGKISEDGEIIVCLPNKLIIKIVGKEDSNNVDITAQ